MKGFITLCALIQFVFGIAFYQNDYAIPSDSYESLLSRRPNTALDLKDIKTPTQSFLSDKEAAEGVSYSRFEPYVSVYGDNYELPLWHQYRHSALSFWPYKIILSALGPDLSHKAWIHGIRFLAFFLMCLFLTNIYNSKAAVLIYLGVYLLNPVSYISYNYFITEPLGPLFSAALLYMFSLKKEKGAGFLIGFLSAFSLVIRINFLWFMAGLFPCFVTFFKHSKDKLLFIIGGLLGISPYLIGFDIKLFMNEYAGFIVGKRSIQNIGIDFYNLFFNKLDFLSYYSHEFYQQARAKSIYNLFEVNILSILSISMLMAMFIFLSRERKSYKTEYTWIFSIILYFVGVYISTKASLNYPMYLIGSNFFIDIMYAMILYRVICVIEQMKYKVGVIVVFVLLNFQVLITSSKETPTMRHSQEVTVKAVKELQGFGSGTVYTLGESDVGKYEYWSKEKIKPIHLHYFYNSNPNLNIAKLLTRIEKGVFVIPQYDEWSSWYWREGPFRPESLRKELNDSGIAMNIRKTIKHGSKNTLWIIEIEKK